MIRDRTRRGIEAIGATVLDAGRTALALWQVFVATIAGLVRTISTLRPPGGRRGVTARTRPVVAQLYAIGNRSLVFVCVTLGFIGMVMAYQGLRLREVLGENEQFGREFLRLVVSDFGPSLTALMLATRVGAGIAAEIGSMKVTEQIDALRMNGILPIDYLIVPRFVATVIMTLALSIVGGAVMYAAAGVTADYSFGVNPTTFYDVGAVRGRHVAMFACKAIAFGAAIPVVAGFCGLRARGSSEGVGWATTAAVIGSSSAVIVLDVVISAAALWLAGGDL